MGLFMSGVYPLTMSLPTSLGLTVQPKNTSSYAMGGCVGTALFPYIIGLVMAKFGPDSLFWCMAVVAIIMAVIFRGLIKEGEILRKRQRILTITEHI
jgi:fucose permease